MKTATHLLTASLLCLPLLTTACGRSGGGGGSDPPPPARCGSCASYEACMPSGFCGLDPNATWFFAVDSARIAPRKANGDSWDLLGNAPDPFVILDDRRSQAQSNTLTPIWQEGATYTAVTLLTQGVSVTVYDEDAEFDDLIGGPSRVRPTEADLRRGSLTVSNLGQVESITFLLAPR